MIDRRALFIVAICILGAAWILIPHRFEGPVVLVLSEHFGLGVHLTDPLGVVVPAVAIAATHHR